MCKNVEGTEIKMDSGHSISNSILDSVHCFKGHQTLKMNLEQSQAYIIRHERNDKAHRACTITGIYDFGFKALI